MDTMTNTTRHRLPLWKWLLLLVANFVIATILYGLGGVTVALMEVPTALKIAIPVVLSVVMLVLYALWIRWVEKRDVYELSMKQMLPDLAWGLFIGVGFIAVVTGVMALLGGYGIVEVHWDWAFVFSEFSFFLVIAVGEELMFRGVLFRMLDERWGTIIALIITALLFGIAHIGNEGASLWSCIAIAVEAGFLLAAAYKVSGNLWFPIGIHWAWNFMEGPFFGFAVSGSNESSVITPSIKGSDWLTGGAFGAENSLIAVVLGLAIAFLLLRRARCR